VWDPEQLLPALAPATFGRRTHGERHSRTATRGARQARELGAPRVSSTARRLVSVVVPVRNEAPRVGACLEGLLAQDYGLARMEIIVVDGMSTDGTRDILQTYAARYPNIRMLDNPGRIVPVGMNMGIRAAGGDYIIRVDGHTVLPPNYVSLCVRFLEQTGADNVGGTMRAMGDGYLAKAIAIATSSPFGVGNSPFHYSDKAQWVDTVYLGAFRREALERVGLYDESLVRNQDYELNYRIRKAGGRIFYTPEIFAYYYGRDSLGALWRQYHQYGLWKVRVIARHPGSAQVRHFAAPLFVAGLLSLGVLAPVLPFARWLLGLQLMLYALAGVTSSTREALRKGLKFLPVLPLVFLVLHLSWGLGFLRGGCGLAASAVVQRARRALARSLAPAPNAATDAERCEGSHVSAQGGR